jgi:putative ABC transport system permease protein
MTEEAFKAMLVEMVGNVRVFVGTVGLAVGFAVILMAANAMAMSIRERTGEVAILRTMGFERVHVLAFVLAEAVFISAAGGLLGVLSTKLFFVAFDLTRYVTILYFYVPVYTMAASVAAAIAIGLMSGALPAWRAASVGIADGLRRVV